jgi:hypothetical protein
LLSFSVLTFRFLMLFGAAGAGPSKGAASTAAALASSSFLLLGPFRCFFFVARALVAAFAFTMILREDRSLRVVVLRQEKIQTSKVLVRWG